MRLRGVSQMLPVEAQVAYRVKRAQLLELVASPRRQDVRRSLLVRNDASSVSGLYR